MYARFALKRVNRTIELGFFYSFFLVNFSESSLMAQTSPHMLHASGSCSAFMFSWIFRAFSGSGASLSWVFQFRFALAMDILLSNFEAFFPSFTMSAA